MEDKGWSLQKVFNLFFNQTFEKGLLKLQAWCRFIADKKIYLHFITFGLNIPIIHASILMQEISIDLKS